MSCLSLYILVVVIISGLYYYIGPPQPTDWVKTYSSTASWGGIASSQSGMNVVAWGLSE